MRHIPTDRRLAELFMVGFSGSKASDELLSLIENYAFTSFIVFERNLQDGEGLRSMIGDARGAGERLGLPGLVFAADEEGGLISPLGRAVGRLPSAMGLSAGGSEERARSAASVVAGGLREIGLDLVLAPVLDVNDEPDNPVIGTRSFGDDPQLVASIGGAVLEGYHSARLACCVKHFPGHGSTREDSHKCLPVVESTPDKIRLKGLPPFKAAFVRGAEAVMTAHVAYPSIDVGVKRPATLSPAIITDLLRKKLGFQGAVISDSVEMVGLSGHMPAARACVEALKAGVDLFICVDPALAQECVGRVHGALESGELKDEVVERALRNITRLKSVSRGHLPRTLETAFPMVATDRDSILSECYTASITLLGSDFRKLKKTVADVSAGALLLPAGLPEYETTDAAFAEWMLPDLGVGDRWRIVSYPLDPADGELQHTMDQTADCDGVIFCGLARGPAPPGQRQLCDAIAGRGNLVATAALLDPYEAISHFPQDLPRIATYGYWPECLAALLDLLFGMGGATGVLPVAEGRG